MSTIKTLSCHLFLQALLTAFYAPGLIAEEPATQLYTTSSMREETRYVVRCMERIHYLSEPIGSIDTDQFLENYMSDLDLHRLFYKQEEVDGYKQRFGSSVGRFLHQGNLYPAFVIFETYRRNGLLRIDWIIERLTGDFTFEETLTYAPDRQEARWPSSDEEADTLWERRIQYELLNEILSQTSADEKDAEGEHTIDKIQQLRDQLNNPEKFQELLVGAKENVQKRYERMKKTLTDLESSEVQELFLTSLTHMYDPHSNFLSADSLEEFAIAMRNSLVGIGAILSDEEGYCTIRELLPGGPAERSKLLQPEDKIVGVAQREGEFTDVIGMKLRKIVKMIRGKKGTTVRLLIRPGDGDPGDREVVTLVRDEIKLTANLAKAEVFDVPNGDNTIPLGVIDLPAFYGSSSDSSSTTSDVSELLLKLKDMGVKGIVLDLRRNGGGLLSEAISLTGLFIPIGPVVQVRDTIGQVKEHNDKDPSVAWDGPLIVLVSRYSASASEIAAGALKNHGRAIIVGDEETHGKGTVQAVFEMDHGGFLSALKPRRGAAKVTIQKYYLPDGTSTQIKGVNSDIVLPSLNKYLPIGESDLPNALKWDTIDSLDWDYGVDFNIRGPSIDEPLISFLQQRSAARLHALPEFDYLKDSIEWFRKRQEQKEFSLNINTRLDIRGQDEQFRDAMEERLDQLSSLNYDSSEVLLNVTEAQNAEHDKIVAEIEAEQALKASSANEGVVAANAEASDEDEDASFDIHLRESLRILADWVSFTPSTNSGQVAIHQEAEPGA